MIKVSESEAKLLMRCGIKLYRTRHHWYILALERKDSIYV